MKRADKGALCLRLFGRQRDAEVQNLYFAVRVDEHIVGLYVAVDNPAAMCAIQGVAELRDNAKRFWSANWMFSGVAVQRHPFEKLHDYVKVECSSKFWIVAKVE